MDRDARPGDAEGEAAALRRCVRDLVALTTLPATWQHAEPPALAEGMADVVLRMLHLDLAYVRVPHDGVLLEAGRTGHQPTTPGRGAELGRRLQPLLRFDGSEPPPVIPSPDGPGMLAIVVLPIGRGRDCGWLVAGAARDDFPDEHERLLLGVAVNQVLLMLQHKSTEASLREEAVTLETLNRIGESLAAELTLEPLVQQVTDAATRLCGAQFGAFFYNVQNELGEAYQLYTLAGAPREAFAAFPMPRKTAVFGPTFDGLGLVRSDDIRTDPRYGLSAPHHGLPAGHLPVVSYLAVPVISRSKEVLGGLFFGHADAGQFTERHERLVASVAAQAAIAIDNSRLYERLRDTAARLAEADRRKDQFLATLAHELRNPLAPLRSALSLLDVARDTPALADKARHVMERQLEHMVRLVDDLLDMSRINTGKLELRRERVDLRAALDSARESTAPALERAGHTLQIDLPPDPIVAMAIRCGSRRCSPTS